MSVKERIAILTAGTKVNQTYTLDNTIGVDVMGAGDTTLVRVTRVADGATEDSGSVTYAADLSDATVSTSLPAVLNGMTFFGGDTTATNITVAKDATVEIYTVTVGGTYGGGNYDFALSGPTGFTEGMADATAINEVVEGSQPWTGTIPIGNTAQVYKLFLNDLNDASVDVTLNSADTNATAKTVYTKTALDASSAVTKALGKDGMLNTALGTTSDYGNVGTFEGPITATVTGSLPAATAVVPHVRIIIDDGIGVGNRGFMKRSTGTNLSNFTSNVSLPSIWSKVHRVNITTTGDTSVDYTVADAEGTTVLAATGLNATATGGYDFPVGVTGVDQNDNAITGLANAVWKSPLLVTVANADATALTKLTFYCEP